MKRLAALSAVAALTLGVAPPAAAQSEALLDCTTKTLPPSSRERLADAMLGNASDRSATDELLEELTRVSEDCATRNRLDDEQGDAYFSYSIARLPRDVLSTRLGNLGVPARLIDQALDFGPGRVNPVISGALSETQLAALLKALAANGIDPGKVADPTWKMVGAYAAATSLMWQSLVRLR